jgi:hypothetical protein
MRFIGHITSLWLVLLMIILAVLVLSMFKESLGLKHASFQFAVVPRVFAVHILRLFSITSRRRSVCSLS